jgi:hypothetical protein
LGRIQSRALIAALVGLVLCVIGLITDPAQFYHSYLFAFVYWVGLPLGAFGVMMLHNLVRGGWGFPIKRGLEASAQTIVVMLVLFIPVIIGMMNGSLYVWSDAAKVAADPILTHKQPYLNPSSWTIRSVAFFLVWIAMTFAMVRAQRKLEIPGEALFTRKLQNRSGLYLLIFFLVATFAAFDWIMSLEPHWYSTIYGMIVIVGQVLSTFAFSVIMLRYMALRDQRYASRITKTNNHDLGTLLFAVTMFWAYVSFSQLLIIWAANLPEEVPWYLERMEGGFGVIMVLLLLFHFIAPWMVLLNKKVKQNTQYLVKVAWFILAMRLVETYWLVEPSITQGVLRLHWLDLATPLAIGGIWVWSFVYFFNKGLVGRSVFAVNAPIPAEVIEHG